MASRLPRSVVCGMSLATGVLQGAAGDGDALLVHGGCPTSGENAAGISLAVADLPQRRPQPLDLLRQHLVGASRLSLVAGAAGGPAADLGERGVNVHRAAPCGARRL